MPQATADPLRQPGDPDGAFRHEFVCTECRRRWPLAPATPMSLMELILLDVAVRRVREPCPACGAERALAVSPNPAAGLTLASVADPATWPPGLLS